MQAPLQSPTGIALGKLRPPMQWGRQGPPICDDAASDMGDDACPTPMMTMREAPAVYEGADEGDATG